MKEPKDKRTKAYKKWKANQEKAQAKFKVGDAIAKVTEATGIKNAVKYVFGEDCGCEERQQRVNTAVLRAFGKKHLMTLTEDEFNKIQEAIDAHKISLLLQKELRVIHEKVFKVKTVSSCNSCSFMSTVFKPLKKLVELYKS